MESRATRAVLVAWTIGVLLFLFIPIATIIIFAFDRSTVQSWPIRHYTTHWFSVAWHDQDVRDAHRGIAYELTEPTGVDQRAACRCWPQLV